MRIGFRWAFAAAAVIGVACSQGTRTEPTPADDPTSLAATSSLSKNPPSPPSPPAARRGTVVASKVVGPQGGVIKTPDDDLVIIIPRGALSKSELIEIRVLDRPGVKLPAGYELQGKVYAAEPSDLTFDLPVSVTLRTFEDGAMPEAGSKSMVLLRSANGASQWTTQAAGSGPYFGNGNSLNAETDRLAVWAVALADGATTLSCTRSCYLSIAPSSSGDPPDANAPPDGGIDEADSGWPIGWSNCWVGALLSCSYELGASVMTCWCDQGLSFVVPQAIAPTCDRIEELGEQCNTFDAGSD